MIGNHLRIKELTKFSNKYIKKNFFKDNWNSLLQGYMNINFIYGVQRAFENLPRLAWIKESGITHKINWTNEIKKDLILVLSKGSIFVYELWIAILKIYLWFN